MSDAGPERIPALSVVAIGVARTPFKEKFEAPRQAAVRRDTSGRIELYAGHGYEHALSDLESWRYVWVLFWFHRDANYRPKVLPPRSTRRRGVFATRSPHRPNPLGMSLVELTRVDGLTLHVRGIDLLDGTPVLDLKPYVAYADSAPDANAGWLDPAPDPDPGYDVVFAPRASDELSFLQEHGVELRAALERALRLGPEPHPYRRIRRSGSSYRIALKEWRAEFTAEGRTISVLQIHSGYRPRELYGSESPDLEVHRRFRDKFAVR